jgi:hypothetical protein
MEQQGATLTFRPDRTYSTEETGTEIVRPPTADGKQEVDWQDQLLDPDFAYEEIPSDELETHPELVRLDQTEAIVEYLNERGRRAEEEAGRGGRREYQASDRGGGRGGWRGGRGGRGW